MHRTKLYGPPGTGKTTELIGLVQQEIRDGTPIERIAFLTHSRSAREEVIQRIKMVIPITEEKEQLAHFRTIHGLCYKALGLERGTVITNSDLLKFAEYVGIPFSLNFTFDVDFDGIPMGFDLSRGNALLQVRQYASAVLKSPSEIPEMWPDSYSPDIIRDFFIQYEEYRRSKIKFDFPDMIDLYIESGEPVDVDVMFIDEAQDLSAAQWKVIDRMSQNVKRMYIAGDDDQSIYAYLGADRYGFLDYDVDDGRVLPKTYRLKRNIWEFSQNLIKQVGYRQDKPEVEVAGEGGTINWVNSSSSHLTFSNKKEVMILARHHNILKPLKTKFEAEGLPFIYNKDPMYNGEHTRAIYSYIKARRGELITSFDASLICRYIQDRSQLTKLRISARKEGNPLVHRDQLDMDWDVGWGAYLSRNKKDSFNNRLNKNIMDSFGLEAIIEKPKISLSTYHASKGREADNVILMTGQYAKAHQYDKLNSEDAIRLAYVGVTRAKDTLNIMQPEEQYAMDFLLRTPERKSS